MTEKIVDYDPDICRRMRRQLKRELLHQQQRFVDAWEQEMLLREGLLREEMICDLW